MKDEVQVSEHAHARLKQRLGLPRSARLRMAKRAFDNGQTHSTTTGALRTFLDATWLKHRTANNMRVHGQFLWIFCGLVLVTVIPLPKGIKKH